MSRSSGGTCERNGKRNAPSSPDCNSFSPPPKPGSLPVTQFLTGGDRPAASFRKKRYREGLPMPRKPGSAASVAMDGEAQPACRERRPGWPQRTSGSRGVGNPDPRKTLSHDRLKPVPYRAGDVARNRQGCVFPGAEKAASGSAQADTGTQLQNRLRSPWTLSTRPTGGQYFRSRSAATGNAASSRE